jgi:hypothetical protein
MAQEALYHWLLLFLLGMLVVYVPFHRTNMQLFPTDLTWLLDTVSIEIV